MNITEIKARATRIADLQKGILARADLEGRDMTDDEVKEFDGYEREYNALQNDIRAQEGGNGNGARVPDWSGARTEAETRQGLPGREYRQVLFGGKSGRELDDGGFKSLNEFLETVLLKPTDQRSINTLSGTEGGFAVPPMFAERIWSTIVEDSFAVQRMRMYDVTDQPGQDFSIPQWESSDHTDDKPMAGVTAVFVGEGKEATEQEPKMRLVKLALKKAMVHLSASREALEDGLGIADQISQMMRTAITFKMDREAVRGKSIASPCGILHAGSRIIQNRDTADAIDYLDDVVAMFTRMYPACRKNAVWLASTSALGSMMRMETTGGDLLWNPGEPLAGLPVIETEHASELGTEGDLMLADLSQMALLTKGKIIIESSPSVHWTTDKIAFRALVRFDMLPLWIEPIIPANSSITQSWAVSLK